MIQFARNKSLRQYNTFGIDAYASEFAEISSVEELKDLLRIASRKPWIIGGGSNMLLISNVDALVVKNAIRGINIKTEGPNTVLVHVGGGEVWHDFVTWAVEHDLGGVENLALIPGSVGAAPIQNIGAYGVELKDVFVSLEAVDLITGEVVNFEHEQCEFGYRDSIFKQQVKGKYCITRVTFRLHKEPHDLKTAYGAIKSELEKLGRSNHTIRDVYEAVIRIRSSKLPDPSDLGNSGSFFKNPVIPQVMFEGLKNRYPDIPSYPAGAGRVKVPAGWLIEQAGWKGRRVGNVGCYAKQALVIVNYGNATGQEVFDHAMNVQSSVKQKFDIALVPEVNIIGSAD